MLGKKTRSVLSQHGALRRQQRLRVNNISYSAYCRSAPNSSRTMDQILINVLQSEDPTGIVDNIERTPEARRTLRGREFTDARAVTRDSRL